MYQSVYYPDSKPSHLHKIDAFCSNLCSSRFIRFLSLMLGWIIFFLLLGSSIFLLGRYSIETNQETTPNNIDLAIGTVLLFIDFIILITYSSKMFII